MKNVIHSRRYKDVMRGCALMMWMSLVGCGHLGHMQQSKQTIVCPNGEVRVLMRCDYTSVRSYRGGVDLGATGVGAQARYEETQADQDNGEARQHALALQSMCLEYNSCLLSAEEYKAAKYNFEYRRDHPEAAPAARAAQTPPAAAAPAAQTPPPPAAPAVEDAVAQRPTPAPEVVASAPFEAAQPPAHPHQGKWHDAPRNIALWYICERPAAGRCFECRPNDWRHRRRLFCPCARAHPLAVWRLRPQVPLAAEEVGRGRCDAGGVAS